MGRCCLLAVWLLGFTPFVDGAISGVVLRLYASNADGAGVVQVEFDRGVWNSQTLVYTWTRTDPLDIVDAASGRFVARLRNASVTVRHSPALQTDLNLGVEAGSSVTQFIADGPLLSFRTVPYWNALGRASGSVTASDTGGDGASADGIGTPGTGIVQARFNGRHPKGQLFSNLVAFVHAGQFSTSTGTQNDPQVGYRPVGASVRDISVHLGFTLTPTDLAWATTRMAVLEPTQRCEGDVDIDRDVDLGDLTLILRAFGAQAGEPEYILDADFDEDGRITFDDLGVVIEFFGLPCP